MEQTNGNEQKRTIGHLINLLLEEPRIREKVARDFISHKRGYNNILVITETAKIRFGKCSWSGFGGFWNNLIKCYEEISFSDFFIKVWDALVDMTVGTPSHEAVLEGLSRETLLRGIHNREYDWIVDRFFDVCRHLTKDGYWRTQGPKGNSNNAESPSHHHNGCPYANGSIEVEVNRPKSPPMTLRVVDSVGDVFEILNARWIGGHQ